jgi:hypothetical protein
MFDLAMELLGKGDPVPYARCVEASTAKPPEPSRPESKAGTRCRIAGPRRVQNVALQTGCFRQWMLWRRDRVIPMASVRGLGAAVIAHFDNLSAKNLLPYLPQELARCLGPTSISSPSRTPGFPVR